MFNLDDTSVFNYLYFRQRDLYIKSFLYSIAIFVFFELVRGQITEVYLLQLVPGIYLLLLLISFIYLMYFSNLFFRIPMRIDNEKSFGTKTLIRFKSGLLMKLSFFLFSTILVLILNTVIPISLDCFNAYGKKTVENTWSINDVIGLEIFLLVILILISQMPLFLLKKLNTESFGLLVPRISKDIIFLLILAAGFITPTIDGYSQLSFASSTLSLYLIIINILQKKLFLKNISICGIA